MYNIKCFDVFKQAFWRAIEILFFPFDISKWFILGFSAWLATMFNISFSYKNSVRPVRLEDFFKNILLGDGSFISRVCDYLSIEKSIFWLIIFGAVTLVLFIIVINLILLWVSSRFKFIFIDNIANNRVEISLPWARFKKLGNSAFWWFLAWGVISFLFAIIIFIVVVSLFYPVILNYLKNDSFNLSALSISIFTLAATIYVIGGLIMLFALYFFNEFVLLIMYKKNFPAKAACLEFLQLLKTNPITFIKFLLLQILASIASATAVILFVVCTCCLALIPMLIPYLGAVVLLPVIVFQRLQAMELLSAFGPEYSPYPSVSETEDL